MAENRETFDYYATDPKAVEMLLKLEQFAPVIWEPACGEGHISKVLQAHGYQVLSLIHICLGSLFRCCDRVGEETERFQNHCG